MKRLLIVSNNNNIVERIIELFAKESAEIVHVHTMDEAIRQIINDGFDLTIIDYGIHNKRSCSIYELTDLSLVAGKVTVLIFDDMTNRIGVMNKLSDGVHAISSNSEVFDIMVKNYLHLPQKDKQDIFDDVYKGIQHKKDNSFIFRHPNLHFV